METMFAVACSPGTDGEADEAFVDCDMAVPAVGEFDLLVNVRAVSVNPIDTKMRQMRSPHAPKETGAKRVLGWDAAGDVLEIGASVRGFSPGDTVYYAGSIRRPGCNSALHAVDARLVGKMPAGASYQQAAALPLTTLTAWEALFERMHLGSLSFQAKLARPSPVVVIIGGAGGVGSMAIQLARQVNDVTVIATASRAESIAWCKRLGADHVLPHDQDLGDRLRELAPGGVSHLLLTRDPDLWSQRLAPVLGCFAQIGAIVEAQEPLPMTALRPSSAAFAWEGMFTRGNMRAPDMQRQGEILSTVASWHEQGRIQSTLNEDFGSLSAASLRHAHQRLESASMIGKGVLSVNE